MSAVGDGYKCTDEDVSLLGEILTPVCNKWKEIAIALKLPHYMLDQWRNENHVIALNNVLNEWIQGNGDEVITLGKLRKILASKTVGHRVLADKLIPEFNKARRKEKQPMTADDSEASDLAGIDNVENQEGKCQSVLENPTFISNEASRSTNEEQIDNGNDAPQAQRSHYRAVLISLTAIALALILYRGIPFITQLMPFQHHSTTQTSVATPPSVTSPSSTTATPLSTPTPGQEILGRMACPKPKIKELLSLECRDEVLDIIARVASECNIFGIHLGLESHIVNNEWSAPGRAESRCQNIVEQWLRGRGKKGSKGKPVTWRTVKEALRSMGHNELADSLIKC